MNLHYYGKLDGLESCYTFQTFEVNGIKLHIQNSPRFGYEPATMNIKNPAMFIEKENGFYRFEIEDFVISIEDGNIKINQEVINKILLGVSDII